MMSPNAPPPRTSEVAGQKITLEKLEAYWLKERDEGYYLTTSTHPRSPLHTCNGEFVERTTICTGLEREEEE